MLLAIDVGNTQTVVGMYRDSELLDHWRVRTSAERTSDELALTLRQFLELHDLRLGDVSGMAVASVVPRLTASIREMAARYLGYAPLIVGPGIRTGMPIMYDDPKEVGADRIADAVAAYDLYGGPTIVVDFGTATTIEAVNAKGEYLGGAIFPGIEIGLDAMYARTSLLRRAELVEPKHLIGRTTADSIRSGALYGYTAQVDGLCRRFVDELGDCTVVSTGGSGGLIAPLSEMIDHHEPWLTLHGLRIIFERNQT